MWKYFEGWTKSKRVFTNEMGLPSRTIEQANQEDQQEYRHRQTRLVLCACKTKARAHNHVSSRMPNAWYTVISVHLNSVFI